MTNEYMRTLYFFPYLYAAIQMMGGGGRLGFLDHLPDTEVYGLLHIAFSIYNEVGIEPERVDYMITEEIFYYSDNLDKAYLKEQSAKFVYALANVLEGVFPLDDSPEPVAYDNGVLIYI